MTRSSLVRLAVFYGLWVMAAGIGVWTGVIYRFSHPELTETQLFLAQWPIITAAGALVLLALLVGFSARGSRPSRPR